MDSMKKYLTKLGAPERVGGGGREGGIHLKFLSRPLCGSLVFEIMNPFGPRMWMYPDGPPIWMYTDVPRSTYRTVHRIHFQDSIALVILNSQTGPCDYKSQSWTSSVHSADFF